MRTSFYPTESLDEFGAGTPEYGKVESIDAATVKDAVFSETEEMELAEGLLEVADERELVKFLDALTARVLGGNQGVPMQPLRAILRQSAKGALPAICGPAAKIQGLAADGAHGGRVASMAGN